MDISLVCCGAIVAALVLVVAYLVLDRIEIKANADYYKTMYSSASYETNKCQKRLDAALLEIEGFKKANDLLNAGMLDLCTGRDDLKHALRRREQEFDECLALAECEGISDLKSLAAELAARAARILALEKSLGESEVERDRARASRDAAQADAAKLRLFISGAIANAQAALKPPSLFGGCGGTVSVNGGDPLPIREWRLTNNPFAPNG